uniref:Uncharacterized protein n=1 Tax=Arundo donax TaxID=35708 RepID=A0A0A9A3I7_ARUDO
MLIIQYSNKIFFARQRTDQTKHHIMKTTTIYEAVQSSLHWLYHASIHELVEVSLSNLQ